jgi:hypothetical protein
MTPTLTRPLRALLLVPVLCLAAGCALALAAETTRAEYVAKVEPICKANTKANERVLMGVRKEVKEGQLKPAASQFARAATALKRALGQLRAVPQPLADKARLAQWLGYVKGEVELFEATAADLKAGRQSAAERNSAKLSREANLANDQVLPFEFEYCRAEPSKFV